MTATTVRILHCDAAGCTQSTTEDQADGWSVIYTHGCPTHRDAIEAHKAKVTSTTCGRGHAEKTTWFLTCVCGWWPRPHYVTHSARWLHEQHLAHVKDATG